MNVINVCIVSGTGETLALFVVCRCSSGQRPVRSWDCVSVQSPGAHLQGKTQLFRWIITDYYTNYDTWDKRTRSSLKIRDHMLLNVWYHLLFFCRASVQRPCWWSDRKILDKLGKFFVILQMTVCIISRLCPINRPTMSMTLSVTASTPDQNHPLMERSHTQVNFIYTRQHNTLI